MLKVVVGDRSISSRGTEAAPLVFRVRSLGCFFIVAAAAVSFLLSVSFSLSFDPFFFFFSLITTITLFFLIRSDANAANTTRSSSREARSPRSLSQRER